MTQNTTTENLSPNHSLSQDEEKEDSLSAEFFYTQNRLEKVSEAVYALLGTRYKSVWREGGTITRDADDVRETFLRDFVQNFEKALQQGINKAQRVTAQRAQECFSKCAEMILQQAKEKCQEIDALKEFSAFCFVFDKPFTPKKVGSLHLESAYELEKVQKVEQSEKYMKEGFWNWCKSLFDCEEYETRTWTERHFEAPSLGDIFITMQEQLMSHKHLIDLLEQFLSEDGFMGQFIEHIETVVKSGVSQYQTVIDESVGKITQETEERNELLAQYRQRVRESIENIEI